MQRIVTLLSMAILLHTTGCGEPAPTTLLPPLISDAPVKTADVKTELWGGLKVHTAGTVLKNADYAVVLMHGYGALGTDLVGFEKYIATPPNTAFVFPEGPIQLEHGGRCWSNIGGDGFEESRSRMKALLRHLTTQRPECKIVLGGFSQGATMTVNLLATAECPGLIGAVLYSPANRLTHAPPADQMHPAVFISHGRQDNVLAISGSESLRNELENLGCNVTWAPFDGAHTISPVAIHGTNDFIAKITQSDQSNVK